MLSRRQINVQRENLASMCRISVKSLLDHACLYTHVDDDCEEFINFCAVFEQMVSHRLRPYQKKVWLPGQGAPRHFWDVLVDNHNRSRGFLFQTCIPNIEAIENIKSPKAKLRAFIRVALMEKRLSDYMCLLLDNTSLIRESYLDGALIASEEATVLCGDLIGLNAIDFNFCLKGNENELLGPLEISYGPFLKYKQTTASRSSDEIEMMRLSGRDVEEEEVPVGHPLTDSDVDNMLRLQTLEKDFRSMKEQKDYLEELLRLRERQAGEVTARVQSMRQAHERAEAEWAKERRLMDSCVLELQAEIAKLRQQNELLKVQTATLRQYKQHMEMRELPMIDMAVGGADEIDKSESHVQMDQVEDRVSLSQTSMVVMLHRKKEHSPIPSDQRSIMSSVSDQIRLKEDSQSMVPLTGSLADVNAAMLDSKDYPERASSVDRQISSQSDMTKLGKGKHQKETELKHRSAEALVSHNQSQDVTSAQLATDSTAPVPRASTPEIRVQDDTSAPESSEFTSQTADVPCVADAENENNSNQAGLNMSSSGMGITESYVITGDTVEMGETGLDLGLLHPQGMEVQEGTGEAGVGAGLLGFQVDGSHIVVARDERRSSNGDPEREDILTSDAEIIEHDEGHGNTSSDSSDAAWDMVFDSEQATGRGEQQQ